MRLVLVLLLLISLPLMAWERVYLASYPRSGTHWVRYLVEEVTGVATGAVYCDNINFGEPLTVNHDPNHRPWGGYTIIGGYEGNRSEPTPEYPVLIKTHYPVAKTPDDHNEYLRTIRLVRDPKETIRSCMRGVKHERSRLISLIRGWAHFQNYWDQQRDVITIRYEDLKESPEEELARIIAALGYPVDCEAIRGAVERYPPLPSRLDNPNFYAEEELVLFDIYAGREMAQLGY